MRLTLTGKHGSGFEKGRAALLRRPTVLEQTSMSTNNDDGEKVVVRQSDNYGSRHSRLPGVDDAAVSIDTPETFGDEPIGVSGFAYDDTNGEVQLTFGSDIQVAVFLDPDDARVLAEQLEVAADEADAEIGE